MIKPEVLDAMVAAGCTAEQIAAAVKADQASSTGAARQARYRARKASLSDERYVTTVTVTEGLSSPEVSPQTPFPKPHQSNPPSPPKGGSSPAEVDLAFDVWDEMASANGLATVRLRSEARRRRLGSVLRQHGIETWREACRRVGASAFCRGEVGDRPFRADLDFVLQAKSFGRILEGHYDDRTPPARGSPPGQKPKTIFEASTALLAEMMEADDGTEPAEAGERLEQNVRYLTVAKR